MEERIVPSIIMKTVEENKKDFSIGSINKVIGKLNKTSLLLIVVVYIVVLSVILGLVGNNISYIHEPSYDHVLYNEEITPQITIVGRRTLNSDDSIRLRYNVNAYITSRYVDGTAPKLDIQNFRMFAITTKELTNNNKLSNYYFTEQSGYTTPVTHTYTIDNSSVDQHPSSMYVRIAYKKDGVEKIATFKEPIMLQPTESDKNIMKQWYEANKESTYVDENGIEQIEKAKSAVNIYSSSDQTNSMGTFEVAVSKKADSETNDNKVSIRIKIKNQASKKFHIDVQTWIVTENDEYLPLIGGYNYTSQVSMFTSDTEVPGKIKVKYVAMKLLYRDENNKVENASYLYQDYTKIKETLSTNPDTPDNNIIKPGNNETIIILSIVLGTIIIVVAVVIVISVIEKKKKNIVETEETQKNLDTNKKI